MAKLEVVPSAPGVWTRLRDAAAEAAAREPVLASQMSAVVLS
ncbi:serine O-acetyltransferase, partial [Klebsiella pneumoniae]|nr:serine O-acetyltransferase [Klebsiella pneumoniae]